MLEHLFGNVAGNVQSGHLLAGYVILSRFAARVKLNSSCQDDRSILETNINCCRQGLAPSAGFN
jgi:hypothetical protein